MEIVPPRNIWSVPIFEFRDAGSVTGDKIETNFRDIQNWLVRTREEHTVPPSGTTHASSSGHRRGLEVFKSLTGSTKKSDQTDSCKCPRKRRQMKHPEQCDKCPKGQIGISQKSNSDSKPKCKTCPKGQKPNGAANKCLEDCPVGKKLNPAGKECIMECPKGKQPNSTRDKCELHCAIDKISNKAGGVLERCVCKNGAHNAKCDPKEDEERDKEGKQRKKEQEKKKEEAVKDLVQETKEKVQKQAEKAKTNNDKQKTRQNKVCLAFVAAGTASETFNPDDLDEAGEQWPDDAEVDWSNWVNVTESNIVLPPEYHASVQVGMETKKRQINPATWVSSAARA